MAVKRASDVVAIFGVNTHINYTDGHYVDIGRVLDALNYLGIDKVRDHQPVEEFDPLGQRHLGQAADAGIKFNFVVQPYWETPEQAAAAIREFLIAHPDSVTAIEGPNELNNFPVTYEGKTGTAAALAYQEDLFNLVNADPLLRDIPVLGFTNYPFTASVNSDWNNIHPYEREGDQPHEVLVSDLMQQENVEPGKPFAITETGYHTALGADTNGGWEGVSYSAQAKFILNTYMGAAELDSRLTYTYELLDAYPDPNNSLQEHSFGLFDYAYNPKPAATALRNLNTILEDTGPNAGTFTPQNLNVQISGIDGAPHHQIVMANSDGSYDIAAWLERDIWDQASDQEINNPADQVTINLGATFAKVEVFDPLQGSNPIQTFTNVSSFSHALDDSVLIFEAEGRVVPPVGRVIFGTAGDDFLTGGMSAGSIYGVAGSDTIHGAGGEDFILGGAGADQLQGGGGKDIFRFTTADSGSQDDIVHFSRVEDLLDVSPILGNNATFGGQAGPNKVTVTTTDGVSLVKVFAPGDSVANVIFNVNGKLTVEDFIF